MTATRNTWAIVLAGGSGARMGAPVNKVLLPIGGKPALARTLGAFAQAGLPVVLVARAQDLMTLRKLIRHARLPMPRFATGGNTRQASVRAGLNALPADVELVLVHDGARALVTPELIARVLDSVHARGNGVAAVPLTDTVKRVGPEGRVAATLERDGLFAMQTPQGFRVRDLRVAHERAALDGYLGTDDAALLEHAGLPVFLCEGSRENIKLTTPADLALAKTILHQRRGRKQHARWPWYRRT